jgi:hypothetical protein
MSLTGQWINGYNSVMNLTQAADGAITGDYSSTTGSAGKYYVLGHANPTQATPSLGQSVALSIYWRPYTGGTGDASWHWVSGLSGQMSVVGGAPARSIALMHALIATCDLPGLAHHPGTYLDKLVYVPHSQGAPVCAQTAQPEARTEDAVSGTWICNDPPLALFLEIQKERPGQLGGVLERPDRLESPVQGFTDPFAGSGGLDLQAVSLSTFDGATGKCLCLVGTLNLRTGVLALQELASGSTAPDSTYLQTTTATRTFVRAATRYACRHGPRPEGARRRHGGGPRRRER